MINDCILTTIDIGIGIGYNHVCVLRIFYWKRPTQVRTEAEFLDKIGTKVFKDFLLAIHSHLH